MSRFDSYQQLQKKMKTQEYLTTPLATRQMHLVLDEPCQERGGTSQHHKGVLAQYIGSPIYGKPADLCHACHNGKCSNPKHLYWGSRSENMKDAYRNGNKTGYERLVEKIGEEATRALFSERAKESYNARKVASQGT